MTQMTGWKNTVGTAIALQWALVLIFAVAAWLLIGKFGALSLFLGGAAVALPNAVLALWLTLRLRSKGAVGAVGMMSGELLKLVFTLAAIVLVAVKLKPELSWLAMLTGVIVALKAQWLALWVTRRY
ncbi:MAG: ATP synthase subunit I [Pseudomonadota bacterium]